MLVKHPKDSLTILTDLVLPGETNYLDSLFGGELLARMDRACSIAARRHADKLVVTASVNHVAFNKSVPSGSVLTIEAKVSRAFSSSMEVYVDVWIDTLNSEDKTKVNEGIYTFVAVDNNGKPTQVPELIPQTDLEKKRFAGALRRKQLSLVLGGRMDPNDATELKSLFKKPL